MCPENYSVKHIPRITNIWGGGVAIVYKSCLNIKITEQFKYNSFEHIEVVFTSGSFAFRIVVIYRPPPSATNKFTEKMFVNEFQDYLEKLYSKSGKLVLVGDFNFHVENTETCSQFLDIFHDFNLKQHINEPTHKDQGTLDLIITRDSDDIIAEICVTNPLLSDHFAVECSILAKINIPTKSVISFRKLKSIDIDSFKRDIENSELINENENIESMISKFNSVLEKILNNHAPIIHKLVPIRTIVPWINDEIKQAKAHRRKWEAKWRRSRSHYDFSKYKFFRNHVNWLISKAKKDYYCDKIKSNQGNQKSLFKTINTLLHRSKSTKLPSQESSYDLACHFQDFFIEKENKIRQDLLEKNNGLDPHAYDEVAQSELNHIKLCSLSELKKIILASPSKHCASDPIPTWLLKECIDILAPSILKIVNTSISTSSLPSTYKHSIITPLLKKPSLDAEIMKNYRPVSNLNFISKILEKVVVSRINSYKEEYNLYVQNQSAYRRHHSTESFK